MRKGKCKDCGTELVYTRHYSKDKKKYTYDQYCKKCNMIWTKWGVDRIDIWGTRTYRWKLADYILKHGEKRTLNVLIPRIYQSFWDYFKDKYYYKSIDVTLLDDMFEYNGVVYYSSTAQFFSLDSASLTEEQALDELEKIVFNDLSKKLKEERVNEYFKIKGD